MDTQPDCNIQATRKIIAEWIALYGMRPLRTPVKVFWDDGAVRPTAVLKATPITPEAFKDHRHE